MNTVNQIGIYNMALAEIGVSRFIQSLQDTSVQKQTCDVFWESVRDQCLSDFPWTFAMRFAQLQILTKKVPQWCYVYGYPADCLAARHLVPTPNTTSPAPPGFLSSTNSVFPFWWDQRWWECKIPFQTVENEAGGGLAIATDLQFATLMYTARVEAYTLWTPAFVNCLTLLLASKIVGPLANNLKYATALGQAYEAALLKAGASSMNEQQERPEQDSELILTRG
jgi:hypothetical protein